MDETTQVPMVACAHVFKRFALTPVLHDLTFDIAAGEFIAVIGRNGVGKSTLLRLLGGLTKPDSGEIMLAGRSVEVAGAQKSIAFVPQRASLLGWRTARENVRLALEVNRQLGCDVDRVTDDTLIECNLGHLAKRYPRELSGGQQHRVNLARALVTRAPILLLDEPFSAADELTRFELYEVLLASWQRHHQTIVMVTHNIEESVLLADRVIAIGGTPASIVGQVTIAQHRPRLEPLLDGGLADESRALRAMLGARKI